MKRLNLMLHCGAAAVDRSALSEVATPAATKTWQPIPHTSLVDMLTERVPQFGMEIVQEAHGLTKDGDRYFGMFQVAPIHADGANGADNDMGLVFGVRNSHDKTYPAGLCCGSGVFVCDNLSFSAEITLARKHTRHIMRDLAGLYNKAVGKLMEARVMQAQRFDAYKETELSDTQAHDLIVKALRAEAVPATKVPAVVEQWHTPAHPEFKERNAFSLFNGFTEVFKGSSLVQLPKRTTNLHGVFDTACGLISDVSVKTDLKGAFQDNDEVDVRIR